MTWLAGWERIEADRGQPELLGGAPKLGVHLTEGWTIDDAVSTFVQRDGWPHVCASPWHDRIVQHYPLGVGTSRAFRRAADGWSPNKWNCVQVEIVGFSTGIDIDPRTRAWLIANKGFTEETIDVIVRPASEWPQWVLEWLARRVFAPLCFLGGIPPVDAGALGRRLTRDEYVAASGIVRHSDVPDQDHTDPGALDVRRILELIANPAPRPVPAQRIGRTPDMVCIIQGGNVTLFGLGGPINLGGLPDVYKVLVAAGVPSLNADTDPQAKAFLERATAAAAHPSTTIGKLRGAVQIELAP